MSDEIRATTRVAVEPAVAFEVFTREIDLWWRRGPRFRFLTAGEGRLRFEPGVGGRLVEEGEGDVYEVGRVRVWEPAERLVFEFRARSFAPGDVTEVEVVFQPEGAGTRVTVEHRGWESLADDHPARHGLEAGALRGLLGVWWADLLVAARRHAERSATRGG
jgi:hypothetical protein